MRPYRWPFLRPLFLWWWRLVERDVTDIRYPPEVETKGAPSYQYGKVTGLDPDLRVITETTESPWVCCGYCSAGMACWTARGGLGHSMTGAAHPIRSAGGRPHDNGSKATELRNGARLAHGVTLDPLAVSEIPNELRDGWAVVVNLDYSKLPSYLRVQSGSFGHSCCLYGWKESGDYVGVFDPLWPEGAYGAWAKWSDVKGALWGDGEHSATVTSHRAPEPVPPEPEPPDTTGGKSYDEGRAEGRVEGYAAGYPAGYQEGDRMGERQGEAIESDRVFLSWGPGRQLPDELPEGGRWDLSQWSTETPGDPDSDEWAAWPLPIEALYRAQTPAAWQGVSTWSGAVWRA